MDPYRLRVLVDDDLLGLAVDEILAIEPGAPDAIRVVWPRSRSIPTNYGYIAGLLARDRLAPIRVRLNPLIAVVPSIPLARFFARLRKPAPATRQSVQLA